MPFPRMTVSRGMHLWRRLCIGLSITAAVLFALPGCEGTKSEDQPIDCVTVRPALNAGETVSLENLGLASPEGGAASAHMLDFVNAKILRSRIPDYYRRIGYIMRSFPTVTLIVVVAGSVSDSVELRCRQSAETLASGRINFVPDDGKIHELFGIPRSCRAFVLIDSAGILRFTRTGGIKPALIEQLARKYNTEAAYSDAELQELQGAGGIIRRGDLLPELRLMSVMSESATTLRAEAKASGIGILFSAECKMCELGRFLAELGGVQNTLQRQYPGGIIVLFEAGLPLDTIRGQLQDKRVFLPAYVVAHNSDSTVFFDDGSTPSAVITWDGRGLVTDVIRFARFLDTLQIGE